MTQGLQARNDRGWDKVHSPGTHYTPHQGVMRETHVANRETLETEEERERRGRNTRGGIVWVGGWTIEKSCLLQKKLVNALFPQPRNMFSFVLVVGFLWNVSKTRSCWRLIARRSALIILTCNYFFRIAWIIHYHHADHTLEGLSFSIPNPPNPLSLSFCLSHHMLTI